MNQNQENENHKNRYQHNENDVLSEEEFERRAQALYYASKNKGLSLGMKKKSPKEVQYHIQQSMDIYSVWLDTKGKAHLSWLGKGM